MRIVALVVVMLLFAGCSGNGKTDFQNRYERIQTGMTEQQVTDILGPGKVTPAAELATFSEYPKLDPKEFSPNVKWVKWDGNLQYILVGFTDGKVEVCRLMGARPSGTK